MKLLFTLLFCYFSLFVNAQSGFTLNTSIPVNQNGPLDLAWAGGINFPVFSEIDLNNDNTADLFVFDRSNNRILTFINNEDQVQIAGITLLNLKIFFLK